MTIAIVAPVAIVTYGVLLWLILRQRRTIRTLRTTASQYRVISGFDSRRGNYRIASLDGGRNWWFTARTNQGVIVRGRAPLDEVQAIITQQTANRALVDYVNEHGPIDPSDPEGLAVLGAAGFSLHETSPDEPDQTG